MGYDDQELARYTHPPLSTLVLPNYEMGQRAAEALIDIADPRQDAAADDHQDRRPAGAARLDGKAARNLDDVVACLSFAQRRLVERADAVGRRRLVPAHCSQAGFKEILHFALRRAPKGFSLRWRHPVQR